MGLAVGGWGSELRNMGGGEGGRDGGERGGVEGLVMDRGEGGAVEENGVGLESEGTWIGLIGEEESESGGEFWESPVEVTIGHRAIGVFEERGEGGDTLGIGVEDGLEIGGEIEGAFDAATEGEKAPGLTAGGVFHFHPAEGGEMKDQLVESGEDGAGGGPVEFCGEFGLEAIEDAPSIATEPIADAGHEGAEFGEEGVNTSRFFGENEFSESLRECLGGKFLGKAFGEEFTPSEPLGERAEFLFVVGTAFAREATECGAE